MADMNLLPEEDQDMSERAAVFATNTVDAALDDGLIEPVIDLTLSEALVIGLLKQGVRRYFVIFGHGSTDFGEVLRVYSRAGAVDVINCRNEVEMAHAATAYGSMARRQPLSPRSAPARSRPWPVRLRPHRTESAFITSMAMKPRRARVSTCSRCPSASRGSSGS